MKIRIDDKFMLGCMTDDACKSYTGTRPIGIIAMYDLSKHAAHKKRQYDIYRKCGFGYTDIVNGVAAADDPDYTGLINYVENTPVAGCQLKLGKHWIEQVFVIVDPRGFEVQISNKCIDHILNTGTVTNSVIRDKCVWGFNAGHPWMVVAGSELYCNNIKGSTDGHT